MFSEEIYALFMFEMDGSSAGQIANYYQALSQSLTYQKQTIYYCFITALRQHEGVLP